MAEYVERLQEAHDGFTGSVTLSELNYSSAVIALYGALERFGEGSIADYVRYLNSVCPNYGELPEALRKVHLEATLKVLQAPDLDRLGSSKAFISDFNSCLQGTESYQLTPATFSYHTSNFRHTLFKTLWDRVGLPDVTGAIGRDPGYSAAVRAMDPGEAPNSFFRLDDIAERRNEIAHGVDISELLALPLILQYVDVVEAFGAALRKCVISAALGLAVKHHGFAHGLPLAVYNNEIVCVTCTVGQVAVGDVLVAKRPDGMFQGSRIADIQVDGQSVPQVDAEEGPVKVGMKIAFHAKQNNEYWSLSQAGLADSTWRQALIG